MRLHLIVSSFFIHFFFKGFLDKVPPSKKEMASYSRMGEMDDENRILYRYRKEKQ